MTVAFFETSNSFRNKPKSNSQRKKDEPIVNAIYIIIIRIKNFTLKYTEIFWMYYDLTLVLQAKF